ncbi:hypothetical protein [Neptunomonas qingdaonensis]|uniref:Uncharacterized protein n=1 Tax=Neptunomonas qingdaonensis TaxID=1045558 RepID=A0A1I2TKA8_9GAMM|nr:hypothetical protein [Neptunomonas qingdaonensis]SFG65365.1 hypothetical protein SAMN05216175_110105 [Neptunomonas qingdaonensis]
MQAQYKLSQPTLQALMLVWIIIFLSACSQEANESAEENKSNGTVTPNNSDISPVEDVDKKPETAGLALPDEATPPQVPEPVAIEAAPLPIPSPSPSPPFEPSVMEAPVIVGPASPLEDYKVEVAASTELTLPGPVGELRVWIGSSLFDPQFPANMTSDSTSLPAVGETAKVEAFAPEFVITPKEAQCIKIHPQGSEVRFQITPEKPGTYKVGANVNLFETADCSGPPIPRTTATLDVVVSVDLRGVAEEKGFTLLNVLWSKLLEFWEALLVSIFGVILFFMKDKLKKIFGSHKEE